MTKKYRVHFQGLAAKGEAFKARMSKLGVPVETVEKMIQKAPVIIKNDLTLGAARRFADAIQEAGGRVRIQENGLFFESNRLVRPLSITPYDHFVMCSECGHKQPKAVRCVRCGSIFENTEDTQREQDVASH